MPKIRISSLTGATGSSPARFRLFNSAGIIAAIGLASLPAIFSLAPMFSVAEANAEPSTGPSTIGAAATIVPDLSLSAQSVSITMAPTGSGTVFKTASVDATVSTNNETGYTLYFSDKDDNTSLKHANLADKAIASTENALSGNDMLPNTWGYTLSTPADEEENEINNSTNLGLTYNAIPTDYTTINSSDTLTEGETSKLTFGVKINNGIPSGTYSDEILISAVINYSSAGYDQDQLWLDKNGTRITTMQQMTPAVCASVPTPTVSAIGANIPTITLQDTRNNEIYMVKKLADGNCWMTDDLKIADKTLKSNDSNVATEVTLPVATDSSRTGNAYTAAKIANDGGADEDVYLYNWYAATAAVSGSNVQDIETGNAPQDICPKGWHLPDNDGNTSWQKLLRQGQGVYEIATSGNGYAAGAGNWGSYAKIKNPGDNPLGLHTTGFFSGGSLDGTGSGYYWSRTADSGTNVYLLRFDSSNVYPQGNSYKQLGFAVRCVANDESEYMQNWTNCSNLSENETVGLYDTRDEKKYTVAKLKDGKCWMTKNLAIGGDKKMTLTSSNSDVSSDFELPASQIPPNFNSSAEARVTIDDAYGGYYYWYAVTASTGAASMGSGNALGSICPKGWKLPTKDQFTSLITAVGAANFLRLPFNGELAGYYGDASRVAEGPSGNGYLWSSTTDDASEAYYLYFYSGVANTSSNYKYFGRPVRCVFNR